MRRVALPLLVAACAVALLLYCFRTALFADELFAYRDAAYFYYPLYLRVQQEWQAGRWPLWNPWQNAGMPLLGMPMAAVFYPGKLVFALLSYPWATRVYAVGHVALAFAGMVALARSWGLGPAASGLAGLGYAFGAPVLFQYCNIIYLVGASWVPWGFWALERLLHRGDRWGLPALGVVLALQVLGGDPEAAYLTVLCGGGYALVLAAPGWTGGGWWWDRRGRWCGVAVAAWVVATLGWACLAPRVGAPERLPGGGYVRLLAWGLAGVVALRAWWSRRGGRAGPKPGPGLAGLAGACALAMALSGVQLVPVVEFAANTVRAADDRPGRVFGFCVEPYRLAEAAWPDALGAYGPENRSWLQAIPPAGDRRLWTPSLYVGGLTLVLAASGFGFRGGPPWRAWLSIVAVAAVAAGLGRFGGPLWLAREIPGVPAVLGLGPHNPPLGVERVDGYLNDGTGSVYGLMAAVLPGFSLFRYPGKLMTFAALAVSGLAGVGWDRLAAGGSRGARRWAVAGLAATLAMRAALAAARGPMLAWLGRGLPAEVGLGPVDPAAALASTARGLAHGGLVFAAALGLAAWAPRHPRRAGALALLLMTVDLGAANARLVWTVPRRLFEATPRAVRLIDEAERARPSPGPFRVHRTGMAHPAAFLGKSSPGRLGELIGWERDTLLPLHALPLDLEYAMVQGFLEMHEYLLFFVGRMISPEEATAEGYGTGAVPGEVPGMPAAGGQPGTLLFSMPRRGFDLWNARYLIYPVSVGGWLGGDDDYARIYPPDEVVRDPERSRRWIAEEDWQLVRSDRAFPRAWLVHFAHVRRPVAGPDDPEVAELMLDLVFQADEHWQIPGRQPYNLRVTAFVETDRARDLSGYVSRLNPTPSESVRVARHDPQRVEIEAVLEHPGLVVLADTYYPGWSLTIDGTPAPIYRTNRLMRGAAVKAGRHTLVYTYDPPSFRLGAALSLAGLLALAVLVPWAARRP